MCGSSIVLATYHRAVARHLRDTCVSYPKVRENCVHDDGTITCTSVIDPQVVARWREQPSGRVLITLA